MILLLVLGTALPGQAATSKQEAKEPQPKAPIVVEGDEVSFSDLTGELFAKGNVVITQNQSTVLSDLIHGNSKSNEVWADGTATLLQPESNVTGTGIHYNYNENTGTMQQAKGQVGRERITAQDLGMFPQQMIIHDGTMTTCPAKVPDYHISAEKIEIWPNDKMIAYNAKFWIKNVVIFTLPKYQTQIGEAAKDDQSVFPRIGYHSDEGLFIQQHLELPVTQKLAAYTDLTYYTKVGFKPVFGLLDREKTYSLGVSYGNYRDSDDNWIKKEPDFKFDYHSQRIGKSPFSYAFSASYGKWTDSSKTSWHQDYNLYFTRDPISLNKTMKLYLGTGIENIRESYDNSSQTLFKFDSTVTKQWSQRLNTWVGYHYTKNNDTLFEYDRADLARQLDTGFSYKIDRMNAISFNQSYDLQNKSVYDQDYTWNRDLHCWQAAITYRAKRHQVRVDLSTTRW